MSVKAIYALLLADAAVLARVSVDSIAAGDVEADAKLPAIGITEVSLVGIGAIDAQAEHSLVTSRVQVTVVAKDYPATQSVIGLVRRACNFHRGQIGGVDVVSVVRDTVGPDLTDAAGNPVKSIDFKVTYHEPN
jgi:hypothetical protein